MNQLLISEDIVQNTRRAGQKPLLYTACHSRRAVWDEMPQRGGCWELWSLSSRLLTGTAGWSTNRKTVSRSHSTPHKHSGWSLFWSVRETRCKTLRSNFTNYDDFWASYLCFTTSTDTVTQCYDMTKCTQALDWWYQQWVCETNTASRLSVSSEIPLSSQKALSKLQVCKPLKLRWDNTDCLHFTEVQ